MIEDNSEDTTICQTIQNSGLPSSGQCRLGVRVLDLSSPDSWEGLEPESVRKLQLAKSLFDEREQLLEHASELLHEVAASELKRTSQPSVFEISPKPDEQKRKRLDPVDEPPT